MKDLNSLINEIKNETSYISNKSVDLESLISEVSGNGYHKKKDIYNEEKSVLSIKSDTSFGSVAFRDKNSISSRKNTNLEIRPTIYPSIASRDSSEYRTKSEGDSKSPGGITSFVETRKKYNEFIQPKRINNIPRTLDNIDTKSIHSVDSGLTNKTNPKYSTSPMTQGSLISERPPCKARIPNITQDSFLSFHDIIDKEVTNLKNETQSELSISPSDSASNINYNNSVSDKEINSFSNGIPTSINLLDPLDKILYDIKKICKYKTRHLDNTIRNKERLKQQDTILTQIYLQTYNNTENHNIANICKKNIKSNTIKKNLPIFKNNPYINSDDES